MKLYAGLLLCMWLLALSGLSLSERIRSPASLGKGRRHYQRPKEELTERPIIGMLTLPVTIKHQITFGPQSLAASYVRWIEAGGAQVAPIFYDAELGELKAILDSVNGVVWTGGLVDFNPTETDPEGLKYLRSTKYIMEYILEANNNGTYFPFWGTCLGYERLVQLLANDVNATMLTKVDAENLAINLNLTVNGWVSRLFNGMSYELFKEVASPISHLAFNNHGLGIQPDALAASPASKQLKILSVDQDREGKAFVSTVEGSRYPLYGTQWHPEKAPWEWTTRLNITHATLAIEFSGYLSRFFVQEAKLNDHHFSSELDEARALVHNYPSVPTGALYRIRSSYTQIYFFPERDERNKTMDISKNWRRIADALRGKKTAHPGDNRTEHPIIRRFEPTL